MYSYVDMLYNLFYNKSATNPRQIEVPVMELWLNRAAHGQESNWQPVDHTSDALTTSTYTTKPSGQVETISNSRVG